jgi:hypothetical protein
MDIEKTGTNIVSGSADQPLHIYNTRTGKKSKISLINGFDTQIGSQHVQSYKMVVY